LLLFCPKSQFSIEITRGHRRGRAPGAFCAVVTPLVGAMFLKCLLLQQTLPGRIVGSNPNGAPRISNGKSASIYKSALGNVFRVRHMIPGGLRAIRTVPAKEGVMSEWPTIRPRLDDGPVVSGCHWIEIGCPPSTYFDAHKQSSISLYVQTGSGFRPASSVLILRWPGGDSLDRVGSDTRLHRFG
jgi:hypothetical protein